MIFFLTGSASPPTRISLCWSAVESSSRFGHQVMRWRIIQEANCCLSYYPTREAALRRLLRVYDTLSLDFSSTRKIIIPKMLDQLFSLFLYFLFLRTFLF